MPEWRKICCAIDFSEPSRLALDTAADLAGRWKAELWIVYVARPAAGGVLLSPPGHQTHVVRAGEELSAWTRDAQQRAGGLAMSVELAGEPAEEIARFAREFGCDLIVLGTRAHKGLRRATLGSVAEAIVRDAPCPVLVARPTDRAS